MSSTSVLSSASTATISVFDTISNTAMAVTKTIDGLGTGANMFHRMMTDMDNNHKKRSLINQANYEKQLLEETAKEISKRQELIQKELAENNHFAKLFENNYRELEAILNPKNPE